MSEARPRPSEPIQRLPIEVKPLRWGVFLLTLLAAGAALFAEPRLAAAVERGELGAGWRFLPVGVFLAFLGAYAVDRWFLVRRRSYPPGRAFFQVVFGLLFALLLLPSTLEELRRRRPPDRPARTAVEPMLEHPDPAVRALAVEAIGFRGPEPERVRALRGLLDDPSGSVRRRAAEVLARWSGLAARDRAGLIAWAEREGGR